MVHFYNFSLKNAKKKKKLLEELITYFPLIRQFFCCCRGNAFTEPLPSNDEEYTYRHTRLIEKIYEVCR
jgi:hypothetical protein